MLIWYNHHYTHSFTYHLNPPPYHPMDCILKKLSFLMMCHYIFILSISHFSYTYMYIRNIFFYMLIYPHIIQIFESHNSNEFGIPKFAVFILLSINWITIFIPWLWLITNFFFYHTSIDQLTIHPPLLWVERLNLGKVLGITWAGWMDEWMNKPVSHAFVYLPLRTRNVYLSEGDFILPRTTPR